MKATTSISLHSYFIFHTSYFSIMRVFYGWFLLAALLLAYTATNGITINTLPMFFPILITEFGLTPQQISFAPSLLFLLTAIFSLFFGTVVERIKPRVLMIAGAVLFTFTYLCFSQISAYWHFLGIYVLFAVGIIMTGILPSVLLVTRWFEKYRGLAMGILLMGSSFGAALFPNIVAPLLKSYGWRTTAMVLAGVMVVMVFIPFVLLMRNHPSEKNTFADGQPPNKSSEAASMAQGFSVQEVLQMPVFYLLAFVTAVMWFCIVGVTQNQTIFFKDINLDADFSRKVLSVFGISAMIGKLLFGFLSDRFDKRLIMLLATISLAIGSAILRVMDTNPTGLAFIYAVVYGVGFSGAFTMIQVMIAEYFGGKNYPKILGLFTMIDTLAGSAGAIVLGSIRTQTGSYVPSFTLMLGLSLVAIAMVIVMRKPAPKAA
jgi:MFS transporter, OFA family, oxalate/formate antiporter